MKTNKMCAILGNVHRYDELEPLTANRPIATLPFDCKYRLIDFPLSAVANANLESVFMVFNEGETQSVMDHIRGGKEWSLDTLKTRHFMYFYQEFARMRQAGQSYYSPLIDFIEKSKTQYAVIMGSKMLCNVDLKAIQRVHEKQHNKLTAVYKRVDPKMIDNFDTVIEFDQDNHITDAHLYYQAPQDPEKMNLCMDIFIADAEWLIDFLKNAQANNETDVLAQLLKNHLTDAGCSAYEYTGYLSNISSVDAYYQANMDMLDSQKFHALLYSNQKIYTKIKNEVPTYYAPACRVKNAQFATGCWVEGEVENTLVSRGVTIAKKVSIKDAIIMASCEIGVGAEIQYAILDKNVTVAPGVKIKGTVDAPLVIAKGTNVTTNQVTPTTVLSEAL